MKQNNIYKLSEFMEFANKAQNSGNTVVWVALNMKIECVFSIGDPIKPNASEVIYKNCVSQMKAQIVY